MISYASDLYGGLSMPMERHGHPASITTVIVSTAAPAAGETKSTGAALENTFHVLPRPPCDDRRCDLLGACRTGGPDRGDDGTVHAGRHPAFQADVRCAHGELPFITLLVLSQGWWMFTLLPFAIVAAMVVILVRSENGTLKVVAAFIGWQMVAGIVGAAILGIFYPILQLQSAVMRGS
ncbi:MAG: hypothetical protein H0X38_12375 [Planctomycetes bacterium]|nr:hypothetical protein [Planctomycetota bacterium]